MKSENCREPIMMRGWVNKLIGIAFIAGCASAASARVLLEQQCQTVWQGQLIKGIIQLERLDYEGTDRIYGLFFNPQGTRIEFEVLTNQPTGGVGGMWFDHAKQREIRVQVTPMNGGFRVSGEAGNFADYVCR